MPLSILPQKKNWKAFLVPVHGLLLTFFVLVLFQYPFLIDDEETLNKWALILRDHYFPDRSRNLQMLKQFVFIDTDGDLQLTNKFQGKGYMVAITNRSDLTSLFKLLNRIDPDKKRIRGIIPDIIFQDHAKEDPDLYKALNPFSDHLFFPAGYDSTFEKPAKGIFNLKNTAIVDYWPSDKIYFKYSYVAKNDTWTLPLLAYGALNHHFIKQDFMFLSIDGRPYFKSFVTNFYIQNNDIHKKGASYFTLKDLAERYEYANVVPALVNDLDKDATFDNKIIVIGSFTERDQHETSIEPVSGALVVVNAYLNLVAKANSFHYSMLFFLGLIFSILSCFMFYYRKAALTRFEKRNVVIGSFTKKYLTFSIVLIIISALNFLIYGICIPFVIPGLYLTILWHTIHDFKPSTFREKIAEFFHNILVIIKLPHT